MKLTLKDLCTGIFDCEHKTAPLSTDGFPSIRTPNIGKGRLILDGVNLVSEETYLQWTKRAIPEYQDLIFAREAPAGNVAIIPKNIKVCLGQRTVLIKIDIEKAVPEFICYYLLSPLMQQELLSKSAGSTVAHINVRDIKDLNLFKIPTLPIQRRIASILSAYDALIENNLKRIKLLEELAQRTYGEWFVKFRINGEQLPMDDKTGLPVGWERLRLENCINNFDNKRKPLAKIVREERRGIFPYYGAAGIIDYIDDYIFDGRYLLIGEDGTVITPRGVAMLQFVEGNFWVSNHAHVITGKGKISTEFIYCFLNQYPISQHITGAAQPKISQINLNRIEIIIGSDSNMEEFNLIIRPIINQIFNIRFQNQKLKESRDILLPKLMGGTIKVS
jgi:type I restriction enzyme S subunit